MKASGLTKETILDAQRLGMETPNYPNFRVGDAISVGTFVTEGNKERVQFFTGDVIAMRTHGVASTFTVRRIGANGVGVERVFPYYSPTISAIKIVRCGKVRRAKLFYVRDRIGKAAKIKEKILTKEQKKNLQKSAHDTTSTEE